MKISVILSTYNRRHLLPRMLDSLIVQTFPDFEIILINNGSIDDTDALCRQYSQSDMRIRYFCWAVNGGAARARNFGLEHAQGDYILMVDDDDYCCPNMLETLYDMISQEDADIASVGCQYIYEDKHIEDVYVYKERYVLRGTEGIIAFLERKLYNTIPGTKLFRRTLFQRLRWLEGTRVDDIHFIYRLFVRAKKVVCCGTPLYLQYKHSGNMTSFLSGDCLTSEVLKDYLSMQDERVAYISYRLPELTEQVRYARVSYMISMVERIEQGESIGCEHELTYMKQYLSEHRNELLNTRWTTDRERNLMERYVL